MLTVTAKPVIYYKLNDRILLAHCTGMTHLYRQAERDELTILNGISKQSY